MTSNRAKRVEHFTAQEQPGVTPAFERLRIHLVECDPTACDLGLLVTLVARPRQDERGQCLDQRRSFMAPQGGSLTIGRDSGLLDELRCETMRQMTREAFDRLNRLGDYIRDALTRTLGERGIPAQVCGKGSLFLAHLTEEELVDYRSAPGFSRTNPVYGALCHEMLARGVIITPRGIFGCLSTPMSEVELDVFVEAVDGSLTALDLCK